MDILTVNAVSGDPHLLSQIREGHWEGRVHSVFTHAINIQPVGSPHVITLLGRGLPNGPHTLIVDMYGFAGTSLAGGALVQGGSGRLCVGQTLEVDCSQTELWAPPPLVFPEETRQLRHNLQMLMQSHPLKPGCSSTLGLHESRSQSCAAGSDISRILREKTAHIIACLQAGNRAGAVEGGSRLLGLGPGFTPSGDDILLGLFASLTVRHAPAGRFADLGREVSRLADKATNAVSATALAAAASGRVNAVIMDFIQALLTLPAPALFITLRKVLQLGSSSGTDIVWGIVAGMELNLALAQTGQEENHLFSPVALDGATKHMEY